MFDIEITRAPVKVPPLGEGPFTKEAIEDRFRIASPASDVVLATFKSIDEARRTLHSFPIYDRDFPRMWASQLIDLLKDSLSIDEPQVQSPRRPKLISIIDGRASLDLEHAEELCPRVWRTKELVLLRRFLYEIRFIYDELISNMRGKPFDADTQACISKLIESYFRRELLIDPSTERKEYFECSPRPTEY